MQAPCMLCRLPQPPQNPAPAPGPVLRISTKVPHMPCGDRSEQAPSSTAMFGARRGQATRRSLTRARTSVPDLQKASLCGSLRMGSLSPVSEACRRGSATPPSATRPAQADACPADAAALAPRQGREDGPACRSRPRRPCGAASAARLRRATAPSLSARCLRRAAHARKT